MARATTAHELCGIARFDPLSRTLTFRRHALRQIVSLQWAGVYGRPFLMVMEPGSEFHHRGRTHRPFSQMDRVTIMHVPCRHSGR
jgi:hypothetical protein